MRPLAWFGLPWFGLPWFGRAWFGLLLLGSTLLGQTATHRPRVALVLEGGGALGFAHIGVLHYLEDHHVPIDLVVGTSMGGLVAGLYAIGNSPAEIQKLTDEIDWDEVLSGRTPFQDLSFRRKEDRVAFPNALELGFKGKKVRFPAGLNAGHQSGLVFDRATLAYPNDLNFDDFPTPFRCVATDVTEGREKIFDRGSIAHALRATMAIPAVFSPVIIDGHAYTDGGAVDNLPVDVARNAGAEIVIAVYLDPGPVKIQDYDSLLAVAAKNISIMISANELHNMQAADVLITADLQGFTSSSFKLGGEIAPKGYRAAEKKRQMLAGLSVGDEEWAAYLARRSARTRHAIPVPQFVQVTGTNQEDGRALKENLAQFVGKPIKPPAIESELTRFVGTGVLSSAGYTVITEMGEPGLGVDAYEKTYAPPFLNFGINIDGSNPDNVLFGVDARLTFANLGGYRSEWRNDAFFGSTYGVRSEYYRPFTKDSRWFVAPHIYAISSPFNEYSGSNRVAQYRVEHDGFGGDLGYAINSRSELRIGENLEWLKTVTKISSDPFPNLTERQAISALHYRYYGVDNVQLPRGGLNIDATVAWYSRSGLNESFPLTELRASYFHPVSKPGSVFVSASVGSTLNTSVGVLELQSFSLGGPFRLGAYGQNELLGNQYYLGQAGYEHKLISFSPLLGEGLYGVGFFEAGQIRGFPNSDPSVPLDGSLALVARTALGPVFIGTSIGNAGHRKWWFGLGRIF